MDGAHCPFAWGAVASASASVDAGASRAAWVDAWVGWANDATLSNISTVTSNEATAKLRRISEWFMTVLRTRVTRIDDGSTVAVARDTVLKHR